MDPVGQICGPFLAPNLAKIYVFNNFVTIFHWILVRLDFQAHWSYIWRCVKKRAHRPNFVGHFGPLNRSKSRFSTIFVKKFPLDSHLSCFTCSLKLLLQVCRIGVPVVQFWGNFWLPNASKLGQNGSKCMFSTIFWKKFHWVHMKLNLEDCCSYFWGCATDRPHRPKYTGQLGPRNGLKSMFSTVLSKSFYWILINFCFTYSLELNLEAYRTWASEAQVLGHFGLKKKKKCLVIFAKSFHWSHITIALHIYWNYL